jgi:DNA repair exonuclease SbcCD nuclease subunit
MKFAHLADCHLGSWKHPELQKLNAEAFNFAIDRCISEKVEFVLIVGDLFDSAIPSIDILKEATAKLKELKDAGIDCYVVPGSHDFSISGKSMIHVLEKAGLFHDVGFPIDTKEFYIAGVAGEKRGLEIKNISSVKAKRGNKINILLLHTTLAEMGLPIDSVPLKELPKGFDYYALGHIHEQRVFDKDNAKVVYPGGLFPCNFMELEKNGGSFFIVELEKGKETKLQEIPVKLKEVLNLKIDADGETTQSLREKILKSLNDANAKDKIVTLRVSGKLESGKPSEIDFKTIEQEFKSKGAFCLLRNTSKLISKEFELVEKEIADMDLDISKIEGEIINDMIKQKVIGHGEKSRVLDLMECLDTEKAEGETNDTFASRLYGEIVNKIKLDFLQKNAD